LDDVVRVLRLTPFFHHDYVDQSTAEFDPVGGMQVQILGCRVGSPGSASTSSS
jgi:hypothetical protein